MASFQNKLCHLSTYVTKLITGGFWQIKNSLFIIPQVYVLITCFYTKKDAFVCAHTKMNRIFFDLFKISVYLCLLSLKFNLIYLHHVIARRYFWDQSSKRVPVIQIKQQNKTSLQAESAAKEILHTGRRSMDHPSRYCQDGPDHQSQRYQCRA